MRKTKFEARLAKELEKGLPPTKKPFEEIASFRAKKPPHQKKSWPVPAVACGLLLALAIMIIFAVRPTLTGPSVIDSSEGLSNSGAASQQEEDYVLLGNPLPFQEGRFEVEVVGSVPEEMRSGTNEAVIAKESGLDLSINLSDYSAFPGFLNLSGPVTNGLAVVGGTDGLIDATVVVSGRVYSVSFYRIEISPSVLFAHFH